MTMLRECGPDNPLHVLNLGAGVQSSTVALMAEAGLITPKPDAAIFANTQSEPAEVMRWLEYLKPLLSFPVFEVTQGSLREDSLTLVEHRTEGWKYPRRLIPAFTEAGGILGRVCTADYKVKPIRRKTRQLAGIHRKQCSELKVITWLGISTDEIQRMKTSVEPWQEFRHPLIELRMSREDCLTWMRDNGYPEPPRSACTFCPFHSNEEWARVKANPEEWAQVVEFERDLQRVFAADERPKDRRMKSSLFLHPDRVPIDEIDFGEASDSVYSFRDECQGLCGT